DQDPIVIRRRAHEPSIVARDVMEGVLRRPGMADMKDEVLAGVSLLTFVFGGEGCGQFRALYKEHHKTHSSKNLETAKRANAFASDLQSIGCPTLSRMVDLWSSVENSGTGPKCVELRRLKARLEIVRIWESISVRDSKHADELEKLCASRQFQDFLDEQGSRAKRGKTKQSQLTTFIARKLSIPNQTFTNLASRWKPLLVLARFFGEGILAFLPRATLTARFSSLHLRASGAHGADQGELAFGAVIEGLLEAVPGIADLCSLALCNLVEPILTSSELPPTSALKLLDAGETLLFQSAGVWDLVTTEATVERRIEEVSEG
ncbi:hypothetical protein QBC34DRAFT_387874, partial [Podospora aff. communis PSN243]